MIRKGQVRNIGGGAMRAQAAFVAGLIWTRPRGFLNWPQTLQQIPTQPKSTVLPQVRAN